jgi:5-oxoprolinase (ATP-hydrolysing)
MPLDYEIVKTKFEALTKDINTENGSSLTPAEVACGFINVGESSTLRSPRSFCPALPSPRYLCPSEWQVDLIPRLANTSMARPIRALTEQRGFRTSAHNLSCFGGAGGQHACALAQVLGMHNVIVHK